MPLPLLIVHRGLTELLTEVHEAFDLVRQYIGPTKGGDRSQKGRFSHPKGTEDATREEGE
jgi:hypothetical protein